MQEGDHVEVVSKEDGFLGSYFEAILIWYLYLNKQYIVQYKTLVEDDLSGPLEEVVNLPELRPVPPEIRVNEFNLCDQVDAFDNDGWWIGMVTAKIGRKYAVYFENFGVECVYHVKDLRVHQDWIDGKWVSSKETEINVWKKTVLKLFQFL
ncbi:protein AGENET DOMAIN (AGD)-CONTAINING P1-like [Capsicum annuum]